MAILESVRDADSTIADMFGTKVEKSLKRARLFLPHLMFLSKDELECVCWMSKSTAAEVSEVLHANRIPQRNLGENVFSFIERTKFESLEEAPISLLDLRFEKKGCLTQLARFSPLSVLKAISDQNHITTIGDMTKLKVSLNMSDIMSQEDDVLDAYFEMVKRLKAITHQYEVGKYQVLYQATN